MFKIFYTQNKDNVWTLHDLFNEIAVYFKENTVCEVISKVGGHVFIEEFGYNIGDCEILIQNTLENSLHVISYSESKTDILEILKKRNNANDIILVLHYMNWGYHLENLQGYKFTVSKTTFFPFSPKINHKYYYNLRRLKDRYHLIDKVFFKTTTGRGDEEKLQELGIIEGPNTFVPYEDYLKLSINYKIGLSISGGGYELCHRDFDCMAVGLPLMRLELLGSYDPPLIPNYHYISIDRINLPKDNFMDLRGGEQYISLYKEKFYEVRTKYDFMKFIQDNAFDYYKNYLSPDNRLNMIMKQLKLVK